MCIRDSFNNVLWDAEQGLTLIDFEVATHLAADRELEAIVDMLLDPADYAAPGQSVRLSRRDFYGVLQALKDRYPGFFLATRTSACGFTSRCVRCCSAIILRAEARATHDHGSAL